MSDVHLMSSRLVRAGRGTQIEGGRPVNPPVVRASTLLFENVAHLTETRARRDHERVLTYGARGNSTAYELEDLVTELEGGFRSRLYPTGLAAIAQALMAFLQPGDHVLISDSVYGPVRHFAQQFFDRYRISYSFFSADGHGVEGLIRPETRLIYAESPGSFVYEIVDLPALAQLAHAHGILLAADNTWGTGYLYRPLQLGADIVVSALTKYLSGHSDVMMGAVIATEPVWQPLNASSDAHGMTVSPDDAWLVLRGARTLAARLPLHAAHALEVAKWLLQHEAVATVYHPALPSDPGHELWLRDFTGCNGLVSFALHAQSNEAATKVIDSLRSFGIGASWGGFQSLVLLGNMKATRTIADWSGRATVIRLHIGLEDPSTLVADLAQALAMLSLRS